MVVTRRTTSGGQLSPTLRTSSTAAVPRANKGKTSQSSSLAQEVGTSFANGDRNPRSSHSPDFSGPQFSDDAIFSDGSPSKKAKQRGKGKKKEKARQSRSSTNLVDLCARMFILFFLIYSLSVCPNDKDLQSPVCRGLSEYRRLVLEPYVFQPLQTLIHHPSVDPYVTPVIDTAKPVVERAKKEWDTRIVPQWERYVVSQYRVRVAPHIRSLDAKIDPYRQAVYKVYNKNVSPYVAHLQAYARKSQPYLLLAAARTYDSYQASKPYLSRFYERLQRLPPLFVKHVLNPLGDARRQFVDPHVALLVEKIKELSTGTGKPTRDNTRPDVPAPGLTPKKVIDTDGAAEVEVPPVPEASPEDETSASAASVVSQSAYLASDGQVVNSASVPGATYSPAPGEPESPTAQGTESVEATPEEVSAEAPQDTKSSSSGPVVVFVTQTHTAVETVKVQETKIVTETKKVEVPFSPAAPGEVKESPVSVYEEATGSLASVASQAAEGAKSLADSASSAVAPGDSSSSLQAPDSSSSSVVANPPAHSPSLVPPPVNFDEDDLAAELERELELEEQGKLDPVEEAEKIEPAPAVQGETEEEKAEHKRKRAEENAEKRRDIEERHTRWEEKLEQTIKDQKKALRKALVAIRKGAAADLRNPIGAIRGEIEKMHTEAEKALRGAEAYFKKLKDGDKSQDEKIRLWDRVIAKVDSKFVDSKKKLEINVDTWYEAEVYNKELKEVESASATVRGIAEDGQADIGLPYAWLDDVTTRDWKRYHALMDRSKEFNVQAAMIQNGSHPSPPINPVVGALDELMAEIEDMTLGFESRLSRIRREGERAFSSNTEFDSKQGADEGNPPPDAEVSILPISGDGTAKDKSEEKVLQEVADAILGRSEAEVVEALGRAEEAEKAQAKHEEL